VQHLSFQHRDVERRDIAQYAGILNVRHDRYDAIHGCDDSHGNRGDICNDNSTHGHRDEFRHDHNGDDVCYTQNDAQSHRDDEGHCCADHRRGKARYEPAKIDKCSSVLRSRERINKTKSHRFRERLCNLPQRRFRDWQTPESHRHRCSM
jgi:hypothetical protein